MRRGRGSLTALLLGSAVLLSPTAAHAQALDLLGVSQSVDNQTGPGNVTNTGGIGPATLTFTTAAGAFIMTGNILESSLAEQISIVMNGAAGTLQDLRGNNTYSGGTTVNSGALGFGTSTAFGTGTITLNGGEIRATGSDLVLTNAINVSADSVVSSINTTLAGQITGGSKLRKTSASLMSVTADNSGFTGIFEFGSGIGYGTVSVGATNSLGGAAATVLTTSAGRIAVDAGTTDATLANQFTIGAGTTTFLPGAGKSLTLTGNITGSSNINLGTAVVAPAGTLILSGDNSGFTSSISVLQNATLGVGHDNALGTQAVKFLKDATLLAAANNLVLANGMTIGGAGGDKFLTVDTAGNDLTINGAINNSTASNKGGLVKAGAGTLFLTNTTSNYSQGTQIDAGTISISNGQALGLAGAGLTFNGGTLQVTGTTTTTTARPITLLGTGGIDIADATNVFVLSQVISGAGGIDKLGAGTLQLDAANTFTGNSTVSAGTLALGNSDGFGTSGVVTLAGGTLLANAAGLDLSLDVTLAGGAIDTNGNTFTVSGDISGVADLNKNGAGLLVLASANNSYGGGGAGTFINAGEVEFRDDTSFGNGNVNMSAGTSIIAGANNLTVANFILLGSPSAVDTGANTLTLTGRLRDNGGAGTLDKEGSGTLILTNATSDYTGGTHLNVGTINIDDQAALGTGALVMAGGTSFGGASAANFDIANNITISGTSTVGANATRFQLDGDIDGSGKLAMTNAGYLVLRGTNSYTGGTDITSGYVDVANNSSLGGVAGGALTLGDGARLGGYNTGVVLPNAIVLSGTTAGIYASDLTIDGDISGPATLNVLADATYLALTGNNSHAGTTIGAGATLIAGADANLGTAALDFAGVGATLQFANATNFTHDMTATADGNIDTAGFNGEVSGAISGAGRVNKIGAGVLTLSNASNAFAGLDISQGQVDVTSAGATGGGTITFNNGTLGFGGSVVPALGNDINVAGNGTIVATWPDVLDLSGAISGAGSLTLTGGSDFIINGANTGFTGTLRATATPLVIGDANSIGANSAILEMDGAQLGVAAPGAITIANAIHLINDTGNGISTSNGVVFTGDITDQSGNSDLDVRGSDVVTLAGANNVVGGDFYVAFGGTANITGGLNADSVFVDNGGTLAGTGSITTVTFDTVVNGGGALNPGDATVVDSIGTLTTGNLFLSGGAQLNWDFAAPGSNDMVAVNGALTIDGSLNINNLAGFGLGTYTLFTYTPGSLTNNGLDVPTLGGLPGVFFNVDTTTLAGTVYLLVTGNITQYWDGPNLVPGTVEGGTGTWDSASTNWTDQNGSANGTWNGIDAVFAGAAGTVTVSGTQDFNSLDFQTDGYTVTGSTLNAASSALITTATGVTATIDSAISGAGTLLDVNASAAGSKIILNGDSSFTGNVDLSGTVGIGHDNALGIGGVVRSNSATLVVEVAGLNMTHDFVLAGNTWIDTGATGAPNGLNIYGTISGGGWLAKAGASTLLLTQDNSYTGGTFVTSGTIAFNTDGAFGSNDITINGGTGVRSNGFDVVLANDIRLSGGGAGNVTAIGSDVVTLDGLLYDVGGLGTGGTGTVVLTNAANSFSGGVFIDTGTLSVGSDSYLGALTNDVLFTNGGKLLFTGGFTSARDLDLGAGGTLDTQGNNDVLTGIISGGGLTKDGSGSLTLAGDMSGYAGTTTINDGTLIIGNGNGADIGDALVFAGTGNGVLDLTAGGVSISSALVTMTAAGRLLIGGNQVALIGDFTGTGGLTYNGTAPQLDINGDEIPGSGGVLELDGDNSGYSGLIVVESGELVLGTDTAGGTGGIETQGSIITYANGVTVNTPLIVNSNNTNLNVTLATSTATQAGAISEVGGARPLNKIGAGQLNLTGASTLSGVFSVRAGTIGVGNNTAFGTSAASNRVDIKTGATIKAVGGARTVTQAVQVQGNATIDAGGQQFLLNNTIANNLGVNVLPLNIIDSVGGGRVIFNNTSNASTYTGGTNISNVTLQIAADWNLGALSGNVAMTNSVLETAFSFASARNFTLTGANTFTPLGTTLTLTGQVDGTGSLRKEDTGTLVLTGNNSYAGDTFIGNGTLEVGADANLGAGLAVVFDNTGTGTLRTTAGFVTGRNVTLTADGTIDNTGTLQLDGIVSGSGDLTKNGTGELFLNNANTNTGAVNVNAGAVRLGTDTALGDASATNIVTMAGGTTLIAGVAPVVGGFPRLVANDMVLNGAVTVDLIGNSLSMNPILGTISHNGAVLTLSGDISGSGSLTDANYGILTLTGNNSYQGGTNFTNGALIGSNASAFGTGTITLGFNSWLQSTAAAGTDFTNDIDLSSTLISIGGSTTGVGPDTILSGDISGTNGFDKVGTEVLTLTGANNTYAGPTNVGVGTLIVNGTNSGAGAVTVANGATLGGSGSIAGAVDIATGGTLLPGNSPGTLTVGSLTLSAGSNLNWELGDPNVSGGANNDLVIVTGNLTLDGLLNVTDPGTGAGFGLGVYQIFTYGGALTDSTLTVSSLPGAFTGFVQTSIANQVNLVVTAPGVMVQDWQGADLTGLVPPLTNDGGNGTWTAASTNWSATPYGLNTNWQSGVAVFGGATGAVSVAGIQNFQGLQFATDAYVLSSGTLNASTAGFIAVGVANATINSDITGAALVKQLAGNLNLGGNNSFASLDIAAGSVTVTSNTALGGGAVTMATGTSLIAGASVSAANAIDLTGSTTIDTGANTLTLDGVVSGAGSTDLNKIGAGTLALNNANTYAGVTNLNAGTIQVGNAGSLSGGVLNMTGGTILQAGATVALANDINLIAGADVDTQAFGLTLDGIVSGAGQLTKNGAGTLTLNGVNSYAGNTILNAGTINAGDNSAISGGTLFMSNNTTLQAGANLTLSNAMLLSFNNTFDTLAFDVTLSGTVDGFVAGNTITKLGTGTLTLTNTNTIQQNVDVAAGTLLVNGTNAMVSGGLTTVASGASLGGSGTINGAVDVAGGATLFAGQTTGAVVGVLNVGDLTLANTSILNFDFGAPNVAGLPDNDLILVNGNLTLDGVLNVTQSPAGPGFGVGVYELFGYTGTLLADNILTVNPLPFGLTGTVQATLIPGLVELLVTNANAYVEFWQGADVTGNNVNDGGSGTWTTLSANWSSPPFGLNTNWQSGVGIFAGATGTVDVVGAHTFQGLQFTTNNYLLNGAGSLDTASAAFIAVGVAEATIDTQITGTGSFDKQGSGRLTLGGANTYAGGTNLSGGTIQVMTNTALGTGLLTMADLTIFQAGVSGLVVINDIATLGGGRIDQGAGTFQLDGIISGAGSLSQVGSGNLILNGNSNFAGGLGINVFGSTVTLGTNTAAGTGNITINDGAILAAGTPGLVVANTVVTTGGGRIDSGAGTFELSNTIGGVGSLSQVGSGNLILNGNNNFAGGLGINVFGSTVTLGTDTAAGTGNITINDGAILAAGTPGLVVANTVVTTGGGRIDSGAGTFTLSNTIGGVGSLSQVGSGNLILNGNSNFAGGLGINVFGSTVTLGTDTAAGTGNITINDGAILAAGTPGLVVANTVVTTGGGRIDSGAGTFTLSNTIGGVGSLSQVGSGNLILNGNSNFAGGLGINVFGSTVTLGTDTAAGTGNITINDGAILAAGTPGLVVANTVVTTGGGRIDSGAGTFTLSNTIGGVGSLSQVGSGNLILNGNSNFAGGLGINVFGSTVTLGTDTAAGTGNITINDGAILAAGTPGLVVANTVVTTGGGRIDSGAGTFTLSNTIGGVGSLSQVGSGNLILNGNSNFAGGLGINVFGSTVTLGTDTAAGTGNITINDGAILAAGTPGLVVANTVVTTGGGRIDSGAGTFTLSNTIGGVGSLSQVGSGNLILNGNSNFAGGLGINVFGSTVTLGTNTAAGTGNITINDGAILAAGTPGLVVANTVVTTGGGRIDSGAGTFELSNTIGGVGSLSQVGSGNLILNGNNNFAGGLGINVFGSTVTLGTNTAAGTGNITINDGAILAAGTPGLVVANTVVTTGGGRIDSGAGTFELSNTIGGVGSLSQVGSGNLILNGNNNFAGGLGINVFGSTVTLGTNTAAGTGNITINDGAILAAGTSGLVVANTVVTTGGGRIDSGAGTFTLSNTIGGVGSLSQVGSGNLILNGNSNFAGGLGINVFGSTVTLGTNTAAGTGNITINDGAILAAGTPGLVVANTVVTTGAGTIDSGSGAFTLSNTIGGVGSITKIGSGNLILTGASNYSGATTVSAGTLSVNGTLGMTAVSVASGATLGGTGSIAGAVTIANGGILAPGNSVGTLSVAALNLNASSVLNWELGQAYSINGAYNDLVIVSGNLVLDGLLNVTDSGSFGLGVYEIGSYGGTLTDNGLTVNTLPGAFAGTIQTAIAGQVNLIIAGPGVFTQYWDGADTVGNGTIDGGSGTWSVAGTNWTGPAPSMLNTNWQGGIAVFAGTAGTVTLDAPAAFSGLQFATTGYTIGATGTGGLTNATGAFVYANTGITGTVSAVISGAGALDKQGVGTVVLTAANTYAGGTTITDGTLSVGNNAALSTGSVAINNLGILQAATTGLTIANNIVTNTGARIDSGAGTFTVNGVISGAGSISQVGAGNLVLNRANTFTAGMGINVFGSTVTLGNNSAAGTGTLTINDGAILAAGVSGLVVANNIETTGGGRIDSGAGTMTLNGNIGNVGSISQVGTGNLILNGNNKNLAGLGINQGTVTLGTNNSGGGSVIVLNGPGTLAAGVSGLVIANEIQTTGNGKVNSGTGSFTLSGLITNAGGINKVGSGTLWLTNTSNYLGATTVSAGTLNLTGALTKSTVTAAGGRLAGTGSVAGLVVGNGGSVSPGTTAGAVATLASNGGISFLTGSIYVADVTLASADKLTATGAASITGGTVAAQGLNAQYNFNSTYTILTATGGRTGNFAGITSTGFNQAFAPTLSYDANNVYIKLTPQKITNLPNTSALTPNQSAVANAFDKATAAGWNPQNFYALYQQGANLPNALNELSGEIHSVERRAAIGDQRYVREAALDRLGAGLCSLNGDVRNGTDAKGTTEACTEKYSLWGRYVGSWGTNDADGNGSEFKTSVNGIIVGIDATFDEWKVGALFSRTTDHVTLENNLGSSSVQTTGGGVYVGYRMDDGFAFSAGGTYAGTDFRAGRTITAPGLGQTLQTDASGTVGQLFGEIAYDLAAGDNARIEPFARLGWVSLSTDSYTEAGGYAALIGEEGSYDTTFTTLGVRGVYDLGGSVQGASLRGSVGWMHTSGDRSPESIVAITGTNSPASIYGVAFDEDTAALEAGVDYSFGAVKVGVGYVGVLGKNTKDNGVTATLTWGF